MLAEKSSEKVDASVVSDGYNSSDVLVVSTTSSQDQSVMDSRCSYHMSPRNEWFLDFQETEGGCVLLGNNKACKIAGKGKVQVKTHDGCIQTLQEVRFVPELERNLLSIGVLDKLGYKIKVGGGVMKFLQGEMLIMKGSLQYGLYTLIGNTIQATASTAQLLPTEDKTLVA